MRYRCPKCGSSEGLWEGIEVPGWRSVNDELEPVGDREAEWENATSDEFFGCAECQWEGGRRQLENLGIDGEPLPVPIPGQLEIA